jgi:hypothetical protein
LWRRLGWLGLTLTILVGVVLGAAVLAILSLPSEDEPTLSPELAPGRMPSLVGMPLAAARQALSAVNITAPVRVEHEYTALMTAGLVIEQSPESGSVVRGDVVVTVSAGQMAAGPLLIVNKRGEPLDISARPGGRQLAVSEHSTASLPRKTACEARVLIASDSTGQAVGVLDKPCTETKWRLPH